MATYTKHKFTHGGAGNIPRQLFANAKIHQTGTSETIQDEVWLYISNTNADDVSIVKIYFYAGAGGIYEGGFTLAVPANSTILALSGLPLSAVEESSTEVWVDNLGTTSISVHGYVNRITP
jgi:hypothetical protein